MLSTIRPPRPRLTGRIFAYALADVFGLTCVALGASWFAAGKGAIFPGFPASTAEAVTSTVGGIVVMIWAVSRILQLLLGTNGLTDQPDDILGAAKIYDTNGDGVIDAYEASLRTMANELYSAINEGGGL